MASKCEGVKWIPGTPFLVDGFLFQSPKCKHYFLTHCHGDHTIGLNKGFKAGVIYCTQISARLLVEDKDIKAECIKVIPLDQTVTIEGVHVTFIDANHCPGACQILFEIPQQHGFQRILHTGDFRFQAYMAEHEALKGKTIDILYLDTTYALPKRTFPQQDESVRSLADLMVRELALNPQTKFLINSYRIGKERAYLGAAHLAGLKVWATREKRKLLNMLELSIHLTSVLCDDPRRAEVHVATMGLNRANCKEYQIIGIRATGWEYRRNGQLQARQWKGSKLYGVPYSEHSSWTELRLCVELLKPKRIVPTVQAKDLDQVVGQFADLMDNQNDPAKIDFHLKPAVQGQQLNQRNQFQNNRKEDPNHTAEQLEDPNHNEEQFSDSINNQNNQEQIALHVRSTEVGGWSIRRDEFQKKRGNDVLQVINYVEIDGVVDLTRDEQQVFDCQDSKRPRQERRKQSRKRRQSKLQPPQNGMIGQTSILDFIKHSQ